MNYEEGQKALKAAQDRISRLVEKISTLDETELAAVLLDDPAFASRIMKDYSRTLKELNILQIQYTKMYKEFTDYSKEVDTYMNEAAEYIEYFSAKEEEKKTKAVVYRKVEPKLELVKSKLELVKPEKEDS